MVKKKIQEVKLKDTVNSDSEDPAAKSRKRSRAVKAALPAHMNDFEIFAFLEEVPLSDDEVIVPDIAEYLEEKEKKLQPLLETLRKLEVSFRQL